MHLTTYDSGERDGPAAKLCDIRYREYGVYINARIKKEMYHEVMCLDKMHRGATLTNNQSFLESHSQRLPKIILIPGNEVPQLASASLCPSPLNSFK